MKDTFPHTDTCHLLKIMNLFNMTFALAGKWRTLKPILKKER